MKTIHMMFIVALTAVLGNSVTASEFEEPFNPFKDRKISVLDIDDMSQVVRACQLRSTERLSYWPLTNDFVNLIDDLMNKKLKEAGYKPSNKRATHKQYLGVTTETNVNLVYIFVYPQPSRVIEKEAGNPVLLCRTGSENLIYEFDKNQFLFTPVTLD